MGTATREMLDSYYAGKTVAQVGRCFGISTGKMYGLLKTAGCIFRKKGTPLGWKQNKETVKKRAQARRGKKMSDETKRRLSESKRCNFNGLNGHGHTKPHPAGYVLAYAPRHPHAHRDGYVMLHTIVVERTIGRYLSENEVVHHKNHMRNDNRIENLQLMTKHEHSSMHMKERHRKGVLTLTS